MNILHASISPLHIPRRHAQPPAGGDSGTTFPLAPAVGQHFTRTDFSRELECVWNGMRWQAANPHIVTATECSALAAWSFGHRDGTTILEDTGRYPLTLEGSPGPDYPTFPSGETYVQMRWHGFFSSAPVFGNFEAGSFCVWVRARDFSNWPVIVSNDYPYTTPRGWVMYCNTEGQLFPEANGMAWTNIERQTLSLNKWCQVWFTCGMETGHPIIRGFITDAATGVERLASEVVNVAVGAKNDSFRIGSNENLNRLDGDLFAPKFFGTYASPALREYIALCEIGLVS